MHTQILPLSAVHTTKQVWPPPPGDLPQHQGPRCDSGEPARGGGIQYTGGQGVPPAHLLLWVPWQCPPRVAWPGKAQQVVHGSQWAPAQNPVAGGGRAQGQRWWEWQSHGQTPVASTPEWGGKQGWGGQAFVSSSALLQQAGDVPHTPHRPKRGSESTHTLWSGVSGGGTPPLRHGQQTWPCAGPPAPLCHPCPCPPPPAVSSTPRAGRA